MTIPSSSRFRSARHGEARRSLMANGRRYVQQMLTSGHIAVLIDQMLVSATNFAMTVLIGRFTTPDELGLYSIGTSLAASCVSIQETLVCTPYAIQRHGSGSVASDRAGAALFQTWLVCLFLIAAHAAVGLVFALYDDTHRFASLFWILAAVAPFLALREFGRRFGFAHFLRLQPVMLDAAAAVVQMAVVSWIIYVGQLSAVTAYAAIGLGSALSGLVWLVLTRGKFTFQPREFHAVTRQSWTLGKWLFSSHLVAAVQGNVMYWLVGYLGGLRTAGIFAACLSIALFANPLILAAGNFLIPTASLAWKEGGAQRLRREAIRNGVLLGILLGVFTLAAALFGETILELLYPGEAYAGNGFVVAILAMSLLFAGLDVPASSALTSMEYPRIAFWTQFASSCIMLSTLALLLPQFGIIGAASAWFCGRLTRCCANWIIFLYLSRRHDNTAAARATDQLSGVLAPLVPNGQNCDCQVEVLGHGIHGMVFLVRSRNRSTPFAEKYSEVAVKIYKPAGIERPSDQFEALSMLCAAIDGGAAAGWTFSIPRPLLVCDRPPALVTSIVTGQPLSVWLAAPSVPAEVLTSLPYAVIAMAERLWSTGQFHGDLTFDNVLCDLERHGLSFVDPVIHSSQRMLCPIRDQFVSDWGASAHDLAHLLYDVATSIRSACANPTLYRRQWLFTAKLLRSYVDWVNSPGERNTRLKTLRACTRLHLMALGKKPWSPRGSYQLLQREVGLRRLDGIIDSIEFGGGRPVGMTPACRYELPPQTHVSQ